MDNFDWSKPAVEAAELIADANLTLSAIAERVGVNYTTLWRWKKHPEFAGRIEENLARFREEVRRCGIAIREKRVSAVNDRWMRLRAVIEARADHEDYAEAPGGTTGLLVKTVKQIGSGESAHEVSEFAVDGTLLRELREHEKQAAIELGQWNEQGAIDATSASAPETQKAMIELMDLKKVIDQEKIATDAGLLDRYRAQLGRPLTEAEEYAFIMVATRDDPATFNQVALGRTLWSKQQEVCRSVAHYPTTVVPAGRAVGKSYLLAGLALWWLYTRPGSLVVITGPNHRLVVSVIFKEIGRAIRNRPGFLLGHQHLSEGYASPQRLTVNEGTKWGILGFAASNPSNLSGQHAADLLCIVDEAVGVTDDLFGSIHGLAAQRLVVTGNPTIYDCHFRTLHDLAMAGSTTINTVPISSLEVPDAENEHSPVGMACGSFLRQMAEIHGTESQWWKSNILGLFPGQESTRFFPRQWLDQCGNEALLTDPLWMDTPPGPRLMGVDVGGGCGADRSVVVVRDRKQLLDVFASPWCGVFDDARERLEDVVVAMSRKWGVTADNITFDQGGIGRQFNSYLRKHGIDGAFGYFGAGRGGRKFFNRRTANVHAFRRLINPNIDTFSGFYCGGQPLWPDMRAELAEIREIEDEYDEGEPKAAIETKEALMARIKKSPDLSDALCMTFSRV